MSDAGTYSVTFTATDDGDRTGVPLAAQPTIDVIVMNLNRTPEIPQIGNQSVAKARVLEMPVTVTDPDGNPLTLWAESGMPGFPLPDFVSFTDNGDGTGNFVFSPVPAIEATTADRVPRPR